MVVYPDMEVLISRIDGSAEVSVESHLRKKSDADGKWYLWRFKKQVRFESMDLGELLSVIGAFNAYIYEAVISGTVTAKMPGVQIDELFISPFSGLQSNERDRLSAPGMAEGKILINFNVAGSEEFSTHLLSEAGLVVRDPLLAPSPLSNRIATAEPDIANAARDGQGDEGICYHPPDRLLFRGEGKPLRCSKCGELVWMNENGQVLDIDKEAVKPWSEDDLVPNPKI